VKYLILVPDGCADHPIAALGGKTPLQTAALTHINALAKRSEIGFVKTIPDGVEPGSDAANLSILGYDPAVYLTGRAPLEAAAMGLPMTENDVAFRASLVTLEGDGAFEDMTVKDHSAGEICDAEAEELIGIVQSKLGGEGLNFYPGVSYRCLLITDKLDAKCKMTPPHDILGRRAGDFLPADPEIRRLMKESSVILKGRRANAIWIWGQGKRLELPRLADKYGVKGSMVAAVNLLKGIGHCAGMSVPSVPGATGTLHTNYAGKANAAINAFESGADFVFIHIEAPDECSHTGDLQGKLQSLEWIDEKTLKPMLDYFNDTDQPYRVLILPDHRTPVEMRTHTSEPVPYLFFDSQNPLPYDRSKAFCETCGERGRLFGSGGDLAEWFFGDDI
jgi:2,3-bisphosphoglycerate-independent phosphoglycerate mutase